MANVTSGYGGKAASKKAPKPEKYPSGTAGYHAGPPSGAPTKGPRLRPTQGTTVERRKPLPGSK